jgi:CubicO group peptidase (beta-lactamase class C family)
MQLKLNSILSAASLLALAATPMSARLAWAGTEPDAQGRYDIPWLGPVTESANGWVRHEQFGWMYVDGQSPDSIYIYKPGAGWLWTGSDCNRFLYSYDLGGWIYYYPNTTNPQWFFDYKHDTWTRDLLDGTVRVDLNGEIQSVIDATGVPAMACAIVHKGKIIARGEAGVIYNGSTTKVGPESRWIIGSITKSMTAMLAGEYVAQGKLRWDDTLETLLPDVPMKDEWKSVTLRQILTHSAGLDDEVLVTQFDPYALTGTIPEQRTSVATFALANAPAWAPGSKYAYSNIGYLIAGAILERVDGTDYETLLTTKVLDPLGLASHGFLNPGNGHRDSQPWGHYDGEPLDPDLPTTGMMPVLISTGGVNLTIDDLAYYASAHLAGQQGLCPLLAKNDWNTLHYDTTSANPKYAYGWESNTFGDAFGGNEFSHSGCDNTFTAEIVCAPALDLCLVLTTNEGNEEISADALAQLYQRLMTKLNTIIGH